MQEMTAYGLRAEYQPTDDGEPRFGGGQLARSDGTTFDLAEALEEGDGTIVVSGADHNLTTLLDSHPALKRIGVPDGASPTTTPYEARNVPTLREDLRTRDLSTQGRREDLIVRLEADDARIAGRAPAPPEAVESTPEQVPEPEPVAQAIEPGGDTDDTPPEEPPADGPLEPATDDREV
jgi:hypothetical protein